MGSVTVVLVTLVVSALVLVALIVTLLVRDRGRDRSARDVPHRGDWDLAGSVPMAHRRGGGSPSGS
ncbi:hypothetical protein AB2L27_00285 [Kineococcus sp. LSe6-4]|uniref:Uncharacterized protein n=1 Tax=Kineococcus halophytocola TaxID=3234027 RepID=A0ABV4GV54_9ACTN